MQCNAYVVLVLGSIRLLLTYSFRQHEVPQSTTLISKLSLKANNNKQ